MARPFTKCEACGEAAQPQTVVKRLGAIITRPMRLCAECARAPRRLQLVWSEAVA